MIFSLKKKTGKLYTNDFWTDGVNDDANLQKLWSWSSQNFVNFGYLLATFNNGASVNAFLKRNASNLYELDDNTGLSGLGVNGYVCEAQGFISN